MRVIHDTGVPLRGTHYANISDGCSFFLFLPSMACACDGKSREHEGTTAVQRAVYNIIIDIQNAIFFISTLMFVIFYILFYDMRGGSYGVNGINY